MLGKMPDGADLEQTVPKDPPSLSIANTYPISDTAS